MGKIALLLPLITEQSREGEGALGVGAPAAHGMAAVGRSGKTTRGTRGFHSPPLLGLRWSEEAAS